MIEFEDLFRMSLVEHLKKGFITVSLDKMNSGEWYACDECGCECAIEEFKYAALRGVVERLSDIVKDPCYEIVFERGDAAIGVIYERK